MCLGIIMRNEAGRGGGDRVSQPGSKTGRFLVQADGCHCEGVHVSGTRWSNFHAMRPQALQRGGGMAEAQRQGGRWKIRDRQNSRKGAVNKLFPLTANTPCTASGNFQAPAPTLCMFTRRRCRPPENAGASTLTRNSSHAMRNLN